MIIDGPVVQSDTYRPDSADTLQMQGGMVRIGLQQGEVLVGEALDVFR
jgi:hypothetical protein